MKQQLTEALMAFENLKGKEVVLSGRYIIEDAARLVERLLPGVCENCKETPGTIDVVAGFADCPICYGSGQVWDEGIVEAVAKALFADASTRGFPWISPTKMPEASFMVRARSVLSAIAQLAEAK